MRIRDLCCFMLLSCDTLILCGLLPGKRGQNTITEGIPSSSSRRTKHLTKRGHPFVQHTEIFKGVELIVSSQSGWTCLISTKQQREPHKRLLKPFQFANPTATNLSK